MDSLFPTPSAGFDHPIEILDACHERILRNCAAIGRIAEHVAAKGADAEARTAAVAVMRYFDTAGANHHRDEEDDLFPALQHHAPSEELNATFDLIYRLRADHRKLDTLWQDMRARLAAIVEGHDAGLTPELARRFREAYERHIALEESELLPLARRVLDPGLLAQLGSRMARRRGLELR